MQDGRNEIRRVYVWYSLTTRKRCCLPARKRKNGRNYRNRRRHRIARLSRCTADCRIGTLAPSRTAPSPVDDASTSDECQSHRADHGAPCNPSHRRRQDSRAHRRTSRKLEATLEWLMNAAPRTAHLECKRGSAPPRVANATTSPEGCWPPAWNRSWPPPGHV